MTAMAWDGYVMDEPGIKASRANNLVWCRWHPKYVAAYTCEQGILER